MCSNYGLSTFFILNIWVRVQPGSFQYWAQKKPVALMKEEVRSQEISNSRKCCRLEGGVFPEPHGQGHLGRDETRQACLRAKEQTQPGPETRSPGFFSLLCLLSLTCASQGPTPLELSKQETGKCGVIPSDTKQSRERVKNRAEYKQHTDWPPHHELSSPHGMFDMMFNISEKTKRILTKKQKLKWW